MHIYLLFFLILLLIFLIVYLRSQSLTSSRFIAITYLYILLAIFIVWFKMEYLHNRHFHTSVGIDICAFIFMIFTVIFLGITKSSIPQHIIWLIFLAATSVCLYPLFKQSHNSRQVISFIVAIVGIVALLSIGNIITVDSYKKWENILVTLLFALIILQIVVAIWGSRQSYKITLISGIVLFIVLLLYDNKYLIHKSKSIEGKTINYPYESLAIFLDLLNIYSQSSVLYGK